MMLNGLWLLVALVLLFVGLVASQGSLLVVGSLVVIISLVAKYWPRVAFRRVSHSRFISQNHAFIGDTL